MDVVKNIVEVKSKETLEDIVICQSNTKVSCVPQPKKSPSCWLQADRRSWEGVHATCFPHFLHLFTATYCWSVSETFMAALHLIVMGFNCILTSIQGRAPPVFLAGIPSLWTPSKSQTSPSICFPGLPEHILMLSLRASWVKNDFCTGVYRCACPQEQGTSNAVVVQGWSGSPLNWPQRNLNS